MTVISACSHAFLNSFSQIFLQQKPATGLLFLIGILLNAPVMAVGGVAAVVSALLTAQAMKCPKDEITAGLYGYNAALVGVALMFFFPANAYVWAILIFTSCLSVPLTQVMMRKMTLPAYTAPFVMITWYAFFLCHLLGIERLPLPVNVMAWADTVPNSFGQVIFQENAFSGLIFMLAIAVSSFSAFVGATLGAICASFMAWATGQAAVPAVYAGIWGYNAVLCGIALLTPKGRFCVAALTSSLLTVPLFLILKALGIPVLTAPFVLACWIVIAAKKIMPGCKICA